MPPLDPPAPPAPTPPRPQLSLIFASYQHERYIQEAVTSLVAQTVPFDRVIYFSDGSRDRTLALAQRLLEPVPGVEYLDRLDVNRGLTPRLREAAERVPGGHIVTLSGDDLLHPSASETLRRQLAKTPVDWIVGGTCKVDERLRPFGLVDPPALMAAHPGERLLDLMLMQEPWFPAHGWCYSADLLRRVGGYDDRYMIEDYSLAVRFARATQPVFVSDVIGFWRENAGSVSHTRVEQMHLDVAATALEFLAESPRAAMASARHLLIAAGTARRHGAADRAARYEASARELVSALRDRLERGAA